MTKETIDELERLHEAATPGPWGATINPASVAFGQVDGAAWGVCTVNHDDDRRPCSERDPEFDPLKHAVEDAQLIAAARNALPELLRSARLALKANYEIDELRRLAIAGWDSARQLAIMFGAQATEIAADKALEQLRDGQ